MMTQGRDVKTQVPFPPPCSRLKAVLFPGLVVSSELFITVKNCQECSTREEERETQQHKLGSTGRICHLPWPVLPENIRKASLLCIKTVGKALFTPKTFVPARCEVDTLRFKLKSSTGGVGFASVTGSRTAAQALLVSHVFYFFFL